MDLRDEASEGAAAPSAFPSSSLPYRGDLDAARKAKDVQAIRVLTQLRDRDQKLPPSSGGNAHRLGAPAAFSIDSLTHRLVDLGFTLQQAELAAQHDHEDVSEAVRWLRQAAAEGGRRASDHHVHPIPPPRRGSPPAQPLPNKAGGPAQRSSLSSPLSPSSCHVALSAGQCAQHAVAKSSHPHCCPSGKVLSPTPACVSPSAMAGQMAHRAPDDAASAPRKPRGSHVGPSGGVEEAKGGDAAQRLSATSTSLSQCVVMSSQGCAAGGVGVNEDGEVEMEDPVMMTRQPISMMYMVDCRCNHWFSFETMYYGIKTALGEDLIPACPLANHPDRSQRCNYLLTQKEVEQVLNRYKPVSSLPTEDRRVWKFHRGKLVDGKYGWLSERVTDAFLRKGKIDLGCIECPTGGCGYWVEPSRPREKQRMDCPKCLSAFCSLCKRPYHYRCACDEVMTITKQWLEWQQHGREPYLQQMAREDSSYQSALDVFNARRQAHNEDVRTAEHNWDLLVADENYKASRCRRCPNCHRVIERIDGCDTMVCGQNAHGGNIQNGCGHAFNWNEAGPYSADIGTKSSITPFKERPPPEISRVRHFIMDGTAVKCDHCQANIQGPLATCINCPSFHCCIRCQNKHTRGHVLRLYFEDVATYA